jgi:hypothetical protein
MGAMGINLRLILSHVVNDAFALEHLISPDQENAQGLTALIARTADMFFGNHGTSILNEGPWRKQE